MSHIEHVSRRHGSSHHMPSAAHLDEPDGPAEPDWQVLPEPVPVMGRTEIMNVGNRLSPE